MIKPVKILKKKRIYLAAGVTAALIVIIIKMAVIPSANSGHRNFSEILKRGVLVVAVQNDPMSMFVSESDTSGFAYSVIRDFAEDKGLRLEIKTAKTLEEEINILLHGGCNLIADMIPHTGETCSRLLLSSPLCNGYAVLVQNKNSKSRITRHMQVAKREITIPKSSPYKGRIINMQDEIQDSVFIREEHGTNVFDIIRSMEKYPEKLTVCNNHQAEAIKKHIPDITTMPIGFRQSISLGTDKHSVSLNDTLNIWLKSYMKSKRFKELEKQYIIKGE